jgi:hypothetical protein
VANDQATQHEHAGSRPEQLDANWRFP